MAIEDFFQFRPVGRRLEDLETPVPVIDLDVVERQPRPVAGALRRRWASAIGRTSRPTSWCRSPATRLALGAKGVTVQKLGEAEVMADAGISDLLLTFNIVGGGKLERLADLARRTDISVVADHADVVAGLGTAGTAAGRDIAVLVECDTGAGRNGVQTPEAAVALALGSSTGRPGAGTAV